MSTWLVKTYKILNISPAVQFMVYKITKPFELNTRISLRPYLLHSEDYYSRMTTATFLFFKYFIYG